MFFISFEFNKYYFFTNFIYVTVYARAASVEKIIWNFYIFKYLYLIKNKKYIKLIL